MMNVGQRRHYEFMSPWQLDSDHSEASRNIFDNFENFYVYGCLLIKQITCHEPPNRSSVMFGDDEIGILYLISL